MCPYYIVDYCKCNFFGTTQEGYHKENYCLKSGDSYKRCANYEKRTETERLQKRVR
jgi:hypothetical protein